MKRRPPRSTRTDKRSPYMPRIRWAHEDNVAARERLNGLRGQHDAIAGWRPARSYPDAHGLALRQAGVGAQRGQNHRRREAFGVQRWGRRAHPRVNYAAARQLDPRLIAGPDALGIR